MDFLSMLTGWDYLIAVIAIISVGIGFMRGMIKTIFDLGSWVAAFIGASLVGPVITKFIGIEAYPWAGLVIGFIGVFFLVRLVGVLLSKGIDTVGLKGADRSLGGFLGLARAALLVLGLATAANLLDMHKKPAWINALSKPVLDLFSSTALTHFPDLKKLKPARTRA